jgi:hypothetical protein
LARAYERAHAIDRTFFEDSLARERLGVVVRSRVRVPLRLAIRPMPRECQSQAPAAHPSVIFPRYPMSALSLVFAVVHAE